MRKKGSLVIAAVALAASVMFPRQADATLVLYAQQDGGSIDLLASAADFTAAGFTGTYDDFSLVFLGASSANTATLSDLLTGTVRLVNNDTAAHTITFYASQNNYSLPLGTPLSVESGLGGTVNTGTLFGTGGSAVFQAYLANNNALLEQGDYTNGPQNAVLNGSTFDTGSATGLFNRTSSISLYSITSVATFTVTAGGQGNFDTHVNVTAVPEPGTLAMAFLAVPLMGIGYRLLRRRHELV